MRNVVAFVAAGLLAAAPAVAKKRHGAPPRGDNDMATAQAAVTGKIDAQSQKMGMCAMHSLAPDLPKFEVTVRATINRDGRLMSHEVIVGGGAADDPRVQKLKGCVDDVLKAIAWTPIPAELVEAERHYTFARTAGR